jgi:hypothetical protein
MTQAAAAVGGITNVAHINKVAEAIYRSHWAFRDVCNEQTHDHVYGARQVVQGNDRVRQGSLDQSSYRIC